MSKVKILLIALIVILLAVVGLFVWWSSRKGVSETKEIKEPTATVIYAETIGETVSTDRAWTSVNIFRKPGDQGPELLTTIGQLNEYPSDYLLSPDKKSLLINLERKLVLLDLRTKKVTDLFFAKYQVGYRGYTYSPDAQQLFIWDQRYDSEEYAVHRLSISTRQDTILKEGRNPRGFSPYKWRKDNIVLLAEFLGEGQNSWFFDLTTNELKQTPGNPSLEYDSSSGGIIATVVEHINNPCVGHSGSNFSVYAIVDPVTGREVGRIGDRDKATYILGFSPEDNEVLYSSSVPPSNPNNCRKGRIEAYFRAPTSGGSATLVLDYKKVLREWDSSYVEADAIWRDNQWVVTVEDKVVASSPKQLQVIAAYRVQ